MGQSAHLVYPLLLCFFNRGLSEEDFEKVAEFFDRAVTITQDITAKVR